MSDTTTAKVTDNQPSEDLILKQRIYPNKIASEGGPPNADNITNKKTPPAVREIEIEEEEPMTSTLVERLRQKLRQKMSKWITKLPHKDVQRMCKDTGIKANQKRDVMNRLLIEQLVERDLKAKMKSAQKGVIDPEDSAEFDLRNPNPEL